MSRDPTNEKYATSSRRASLREVGTRTQQPDHRSVWWEFACPLCVVLLSSGSGSSRFTTFGRESQNSGR